MKLIIKVKELHSIEHSIKLEVGQRNHNLQQTMIPLDIYLGGFLGVNDWEEKSGVQHFTYHFVALVEIQKFLL